MKPEPVAAPTASAVSSAPISAPPRRVDPGERVRRALLAASRPGTQWELRQAGTSQEVDPNSPTWKMAVSVVASITALAGATGEAAAAAAQNATPTSTAATHRGTAADQNTRAAAAGIPHASRPQRTTVRPADLRALLASPAVSEAAAGLTPITVRVEGQIIASLHPIERVRLCMQVAAAEKLEAVGRTWRDLYAVVHAETGWAARDGMGRNGKVSVGLAQLEAATARSLGIADPSDPRQALTATARLVIEAANWARARGIPEAARQTAISVYYNLSTSARNAWAASGAIAPAGTPTVDDLPQPTRHHVANYEDGLAAATAYARLHERWALAVATAAEKSAAQRATQRDSGQTLQVASSPLHPQLPPGSANLPSSRATISTPGSELVRVAVVAGAGAAGIGMGTPGLPQPALAPRWIELPAGGMVERLGQRLRALFLRGRSEQETGVADSDQAEQTLVERQRA